MMATTLVRMDQVLMEAEVLKHSWQPTLIRPGVAFPAENPYSVYVSLKCESTGPRNTVVQRRSLDERRVSLPDA